MAIDIRVFGFMSPGMQQQIIAQEKRDTKARFDALVKAGKKLPWDDTKLKFEPEILIDGKSYKEHVHTLWSPEPVGFSETTPQPGRFEPIGRDFFYVHQRWKPGTKLWTAQGKRRGIAFTSEEVEIPVLIKAGAHSYEVFMSLTPMEIMTQKAGYLMATGTVLIGGLGLGWLLRRVCEKKSVKRVIVVEKDPDVFRVVQERLLELFPVPMQKVTDWICGDVYNHVGKHGPDVRHLLDIWPSFNEFDRQFNQLKGTIKHLWGWGQFADT